MTAKPLAPHGTQARYRTCRCQQCRNAQNRACQLRELAHLSGRPPLHPREPVAAHVERLHGVGMNTTTIARRAGVPEATLRDFVKGRTKKLRRPHALAVLAVTPNDFDTKAWRTPLGAERRVRALYAIGHSSEDIAAEAGLARSVISAIAHGHKNRLSGRTVEAIQDAYTRLARTTGSSRVSKRAAHKGGWLTPAWWDEDEIDDPQYQPVPVQTPRYLALAEDCLELERQNFTREQIAARLGVTRDGLQRALGLHRQKIEAAA